jgi:hypothetical protein
MITETYTSVRQDASGRAITTQRNFPHGEESSRCLDDYRVRMGGVGGYGNWATENM